MKNLFILIFLVLSAGDFLSCKSTCYTKLICSAGIQIRFVRFDSSDIDTILILRYKPDNNFDSLIDSAKYTRSQIDWYGDTSTTHIPLEFYYGSDYKLSLIPLGSIYKITQIKSNGPFTEVESFDCNSGSPNHFCYSSVTSFILDSQIINSDNYFILK